MCIENPGESVKNLCGDEACEEQVKRSGSKFLLAFSSSDRLLRFVTHFRVGCFVGPAQPSRIIRTDPISRLFSRIEVLTPLLVFAEERRVIIMASKASARAAQARRVGGMIVIIVSAKALYRKPIIA